MPVAPFSPTATITTDARISDGNGIGGYRGEQERDACHEDDCYNGVQQIALHHIEIEEQRHKDNGDNRPDGDDFHRQVFLCAHHAGICLLAFHLFGGKPYGTLDDAPRAHDADNARHGDASDADTLGVFGEDGFGRHRAYGLRDSRIPGVQYLVTPQHCDARHDDNPYGERAGADNGGIFQPYDIPQPQDRCSGIDFKHQL